MDVQAALDEALANLRKAITEKGAVVTHGKLPTILTNRMQMIQLFQNLIGNSLKFCGDRSPLIHIGAERKGDEWVFSVRDNGIGIAPQHRERIFQIFQRLHGRETYPGTGIGLAICKKVVERHEGRIWVESQLGEGSTFFVGLPAREIQQS
jgi:chemotaxis family two-component system sensor kinase Cph1